MNAHEPRGERSGEDGLRAYLRSRWFIAGAVLLIAGSAPLLFVIAAAALGLWPDPNPNPIGLGLLMFVTFWPAVICLNIGLARVRGRPARSR